MKKYYSQHGEDYVLDKIFSNREKGFFVEVGCIDGKRFSNTLHFEEKGWTGICIEAHNDYIPLLKRNRKNSITVHAAVSDKNGDFVTFYANSRGSLSTIDPEKESEFKKRYNEYFTGFESQQVPLKNLTSIFEENKVTNIDFISLDIEGNEYNALYGLNFIKFKPTALVIECDSSKEEKKLFDLLKPYSYKRSVKLANNYFYLLDQVDDKCIKNKSFNISIIHTQHPLDNEGDKFFKINIDTRTKSILNRLKQRIIKIWKW